jgi:hypothetical protein
MATDGLDWQEILNETDDLSSRVINRAPYLASTLAEDRAVAIPETAPAYSSGSEYVAGQFVTNSAIVYQCILANGSGDPKSPATETDYWAVFADTLPKRVDGDNVIPVPNACSTPLKALYWLLERGYREELLLPVADRPGVFSRTTRIDSTTGDPLYQYTITLHVPGTGETFPSNITEPDFVSTA